MIINSVDRQNDLHLSTKTIQLTEDGVRVFYWKIDR